MLTYIPKPYTQPLTLSQRQLVKNNDGLKPCSQKGVNPKKELCPMVFPSSGQSSPMAQAPLLTFGLWVLGSLQANATLVLNCSNIVRIFPSHLSTQHCEPPCLVQDHVKITPLPVHTCHLPFGSSIRPVSKEITGTCCREKGLFFFFPLSKGEIWNAH